MFLWKSLNLAIDDILLQHASGIGWNSDSADLTSFSMHIYSSSVWIKLDISHGQVTYFLCPHTTCIHEAKQDFITFPSLCMSIGQAEKQLYFIPSKRVPSSLWGFFLRRLKNTVSKDGGRFIVPDYGLNRKSSKR